MIGNKINQKSQLNSSCIIWFDDNHIHNPNGNKEHIYKQMGLMVRTIIAYLCYILQYCNIYVLLP